MARVKHRRTGHPRRTAVRGPASTVKAKLGILSLSPASVNQGSGPVNPLTITGFGFTPSSIVNFNGLNVATTYLNVTTLTIVVAGATTAIPGYYAVRVSDASYPSTSTTVAWPVNFPVPTLATASFDGVNLNLTGTGFFAFGTSATIDGTYDVPFTWTSNTAGSVPVPQAVIDIPGTHTIQVFNQAPAGGASNVVSFPVRFLPALLTAIVPVQQFAGRPSGTITLTGNPDTSVNSFYPASQVRVNGTAVPYTLVDAQTITFALSGAALMTPGPYPVTVFNPTVGGGGGTSNALSFLSFLPTFDGLSITEVPQYFDGFDVAGHVDFIDSNFEATYNGVAQPTSLIDSSNFVVHMTSAAIAVPGVTTVRLRDTISGVTTNAKTMTVQAWDPSRIPASAGVRLWLDGTSLVDDGTGRASQWSDLSGGARHITQPAAGKRPLIVTSAGLNNKLAARFDTARQDNFNTGLTWLVSGAAGIVNKTSFNIWIVGLTTTNATQSMMGDAAGYVWLAGTAGAPERLQALNDVSGPSIPSVVFTFSGGAPFAFRARKDTVNLYARVNRSAEAAVALIGSQVGWVPANVFIGSRAAAAAFWKGDIAFVLVAAAELNATYKALIDNMLSYQYGLPFAPPGTAPTITSISPSSCTQYDLPFYLYVNDTGGSFTATSVVNAFDVPLATEYLGPTQLRARILTPTLANAGGLAISVADIGGISGPIGLTIFAYTNQPGPNLYSTTPNTAFQHGAPLSIDCTGIGFTATSVVYANGVACATTPDTATHLTATVPATAFDVLPGPLITIHDGAFVSNPLEITLTPWSPASIFGLTGWWKASNVVLGAGTDVAQLTDISGNGRHFVQATVAKRPAQIASDARFNGSPSVDFNGTTSYMDGPTFAQLYSAAGAYSGVVFRADTITGTGAIAVPYNNNCVLGGGAGWFGFALKNTPIAYCWVTNGTYFVATCPVAAATTYCAIASGSPTSVSLTLNGNPGTPATPTSPTLTGAQAVSVGSNFAYTSNFLDGALAEFWTSNAAPSAQDLICWPNYCRYHHGTP